MSGPWRCLPGCVNHAGGSTGDDPNGECCATLDVGATGLSTHPHRDGPNVELAVMVDEFTAFGVTESAVVVIEVQPQGACRDGLFALTLQEARQHIAYLQAAVTAAAAASSPQEPLPATTAGDGEL